MRRRTFLAGVAAAAGSGMLRASGAGSMAADAGLALSHDPRRPQYHLLPAANWMNDPNGPVYWRGEYHMFYQYNPHAAIWGDMHWGHAISPDMVHWRHRPVALAPTPGGPDAGGCFSGSALVDGDRVAVLYTGVVPAAENEATIRDGAHSLREAQCLVFGTGKELTTWTKDPAPVIAAPPPGLEVTGFRDPAPWREGDRWYMAVGSGIRGRGGAVLLYRSKDLRSKDLRSKDLRSKDLRHWEYLHLLAEGSGSGQGAANPVDSGDMWECPDFFPLGQKHVLIHSTKGKAYWQSGTFDTGALVFHAERGGVLDYGSYYAPKTQLDRSGNRILWGWITEARPEAEYHAAGWAGMMSLPRVLSLDDDGELRIEVAAAVERLRGGEQRLHVSGDDAVVRQQLARMRVEDCCGEMRCSFRRGKELVDFSLATAESDGPAWLNCRYDPAQSEELVIDGQRVPLGGGDGQEAELRFYIDGSVMECFANGYGALTKRFYYAGMSAPAVGVRVNAGVGSFTRLSMWQLSPISRDRLTTQRDGGQRAEH